MADMTNRGKETREAILRSARKELTESGILGLRVAEVANGANTSITSLYRLFGDRDGLLAQVLGDIMEEIIEATVGRFRSAIASRTNMTIEELVSYLPFGSAFEALNNKFRLQVLAAATENALLQARLRQVFSRRLDLWHEVLAEAQARMAPEERFDERIFEGILFDLMPYASVYLGDRKMSHDSLMALFAEKLRVTPAS